MDPSISSKGSTAGAPEMLRPHGAALLLPPSSTPLPPTAVLRTQVFCWWDVPLWGVLCILHDVPCPQELLRAQPSTQEASRGGEAAPLLSEVPGAQQLCKPLQKPAAVPSSGYGRHGRG